MGRSSCYSTFIVTWKLTIRPILFCSLAVLDPRVGNTMDVLSPFIPVLCHSDWLFHGESCPRLDVVTPRPCVAFLAYVHLALFLSLSLSPGNSLVSSWCDIVGYASFLALTVSNTRTFAVLMTSSCWPLRRQNYRSWWTDDYTVDNNKVIRFSSLCLCICLQRLCLKRKKI